MPYKLKITGPGPNDFEWVWDDTPTELPPVDLPQWPALPSVAPGDTETLPGKEEAPPDAPAASGEQTSPSREAMRPRITITPRPVPPQPIVPDAIDNVFPEPPPRSMAGDVPIPTEQQVNTPEPVRSMDPLRQVYSSVVSSPASAIYDTGATIAENMGPALTLLGTRGQAPIQTIRNMPTPEIYKRAGEFLRRAGESARGQTRSWFGAAEEPPDVFSRTGRTVGESIVPYGKAPALTSAIVGGTNVAANEARRAFKNSSITDFQVPPEWVSGGFVSPAMAAPNQFDAPPANHTVMETVGGPKKVSNTELAAVGSIVLATAGMVFGPRIYRRFRSGDLPSLRPIADAPRGTFAISKPGDLARTYDDANAGAMRLLRRTGIDPVAAREVETLMRIQTRATANAMADSAINAGRMETPAFTFQSRIPLARLAPLETPEVRDYLHLMDTLDDLRAHSLYMLNRRIPGTPIVRGVDQITGGATRRAMEAANPDVVRVAREYWDITRNLRNFEVTGEYGTVSRSRSAQLKRERPHEVPMHPRQIGDDFERGSAVESLADDMRNRIRARLENEAKGKYIDAARQNMPNLFTRVDAAALHDNPRWRRNTVDFKRRGVTETYVTDPFLADVLRMDPYYITGNGASALYHTKRFLEVSTTGELAPWFAITSPIRSWGIGKFTAEPGMRSPTALGTVAAIPRQVAPQIANSVAGMLDRGSGGWLGRVFGQGNVQALSTRMATAYQNSLYYQLQTVGGGRGSILQQQTSANNHMTRAIQSVQGPGRQFLETYRSLLNAAHNAAAFDYARRNSGKLIRDRVRGRGAAVPLPELAMRARHMTGDPRIGGEYYTNTPGSKGGANPIRFVDEPSRVSHTLGVVAKQYGKVTEGGRLAIPWYNATTQGVKRLGEAYLDNPAKFTARAWLYYIAPTASLYLGTKSLGNDPNGRSYIDYAQNGRSEYSKTMNWYVPIPGRPAEEGIEFPKFHELSIAARMTDVAMDHFIGDSPFTEAEDMRKAAMSVADVLYPPMPPVIGYGSAMGGFVPPQGPFGGEGYKPNVDPFDQLGGMAKGTEIYARAIAPGVADVIGTGYAAASQTPEGFLEKLWNGTKAMGRRIVEKTPIVRNILGATPVRTGNTPVMEELFAKKKEIDVLGKFIKKWSNQGGLIGRDKPPSKAGGAIADELFGPRPTRQAAGLPQPEPTNPLYTMFATEVYNKTMHDAPGKSGGMGYKSMWDRFYMASEQIQRLRKTNEGNQVTWERYVQTQPELLDELKTNKVNPKDVKAVRNYYEYQRQNIARVILSKIREVESDFSQRLGRKITLKDLDPYKAGLKEGGASDLVDALPDVGAPQ